MKSRRDTERRTVSRVWAGSGGDRGLEMTSLSCYTLKYTIPPCPHCPGSDCAFLEFLPHPKPQDISVLFAAAEGFHSDSQVHEQLSPQDTVLIPTTPLLFKTFLEFFICDYFQSQFISYMRKINCANFFLTRNRLIWPYHPPCSSGLTSG